ncbi:MAG: AAA family ATPase, partial [Devosia nanyangense]|nr:AAA family ATPase [Devosia nanyangense]
MRQSRSDLFYLTEQEEKITKILRFLRSLVQGLEAVLVYLSPDEVGEILGDIVGLVMGAVQIANGNLDFILYLAGDRIRKLRSAERQSVSTVMTTVRAAYFGTDTDTELDAAIDDMFDDVVETLEASATPGTRKTSTFARMIHRRKEFEGFSYEPHLNTSPLISVKAPSPCTLRILGITIARGMGLVVGENMAENEVWNHIIDNLPIRDVRFIHIDEFQHVMENRNSLDIAKITNAMKRLVQTPEHPVWLL